ncbi:MAG: acetamidase/formamidase family protein [Actinomycetota bacterium]|nr:acetamidase/formamidase family protein [Actinomycetota bacterium]
MTKSIHARDHHFGWDNTFPPKVRITPGETLLIETIDASAAQITADSQLKDLINLDFSRVNPVTGPIFVEGAQPGDAVEVTFLEFHGQGWGWTGNIPGFGLLADQFTDPALFIWKFDKENPKIAQFSNGAKIGLKPFVGTIGVGLAEKGLHSVVPPRNVGGNLDIRDMSVGTKVMIPVEVAGALLSVGDTHAAQGDGEICGTAIESPFEVLVKIDLIKAAHIKSPRFQTAGPVTSHVDKAGYIVTTGVGPDLMVGAKEAVSRMIDHLVKDYKLSPVDAYILCSVAGDLRISEVVDVPNWVVSFYFPRSAHE